MSRLEALSNGLLYLLPIPNAPHNLPSIIRDRPPSTTIRVLDADQKSLIKDQRIVSPEEDEDPAQTRV